MREAVLDGLAVDVWGDEFPLGGSMARAPLVRWSAEPDRPVAPGDLESLRPGPELARRVDALDPAGVSDLDLVNLIGACQRLSSWVDAVQVAAMAELSRRPVFVAHRGRDEHDELRSAGAQVAAELKLAPSTGTDRMWTARRLAEDLPATLAAMRAGEIDYRRAGAIADVADRVSAPVAQAVERKVLPKAGQRTIGQHRRAVERAILEVDPKGVEERHNEAVKGRRIEYWPGYDGMGHALLTLSADGMAYLRSTLDAAAAAMKAASPGEKRTMDQLRADALVDMARISLATGWLGGVEGGLRLASAQGRRPHIQVTVPFSTLIGIDDEPGELSGYGPIPATVARRIAADGVWRRLLTDPATGKLLDYGRTRYEPPQDLRAHIIARDRTCVFPGCSQPADRCQIDHTIRYPDGPTADYNLAPLFGTCHDEKTHRGWHLEQPEPGRFRWTSPVGKVYEREPEAIGPIIDPGAQVSKASGHDEPPDDPDPPF